MTFDVIIVGAGMSGTFMSSLLREKRKNVLILEKSSGIGGRMSTKPIGSQIVDYGCQYIKPKTDISVILFISFTLFLSSSCIRLIFLSSCL